MNHCFEIIGYLTTAFAIIEIFKKLVTRILFKCVKKHIDKKGELVTDLKFDKNIISQLGGDVTNLFYDFYDSKNGKLQFYISCVNVYVNPILVLGYDRNHAIRVVINLTLWEFSKIYICNRFNINYKLSPKVIREIELKCHEYNWRNEQITTSFNELIKSYDCKRIK